MVEYVGLDVSKKETAFCVVDSTGSVLSEGKTLTDPGSIFAALSKCCDNLERLVLETGTMSHWLGRELDALGLPVTVIDARQAHGVMRLQHNKTDANDAVLLARIAQTKFYRQVAVKSVASQHRRLLVTARSHLVGQRRSTQNTIRGLLASLGLRLPKGAGKFAARVAALLAKHGDLELAIAPLLGACAALEVELRRLDEAVMAQAKASPACRLLMTAPGIGAVTALTFVATIDDPARFARSRSVGAYVGLATRRYQSGEMDYSGRISRHGDAMVRSLLYEAAMSLMTVVRRAHPLKDWARRLARRSGFKKACVALARKLAVILHRMLVTGEAFRWPAPKAKKEGLA